MGPFIRTRRTTQSIMREVLLALLPALLGAVYFFGIRSLFLCVFTAAVCVISELAWQKIMHMPYTAADYSAAVTGILIAFNFPVTTPYWVLAAAGIFAIVVVKQMFGGIGSNFANPALAGRLLVMYLWPGRIMQYVTPRGMEPDAVSSATVLTALKQGGTAGYSVWQMFIGSIPGAIGETGKLFLILGFGYLCMRKIVNLSMSLSYVASAVLAAWAAGAAGWAVIAPLDHLLGGGLILGACFMLTDYSFSSRSGRIYYGIAAGIITALVRIFSPYPEGVCYGILAANCLSGLLSGLYKQHVYGVGVSKNKKEILGNEK